MTSEPTAPSGAPADLVAELTDVLADVLHVEPDRIDARQPFQLLGLDSLLTVEFVSAVGRRLGVRIAAGELYEFPTPAELAGHVAAVRSGDGPVPAPQDPGTAAAVLKVLREHLARILHCDPWEIDPGAAFAELGIDSVLAAEFAAGVNREYGLAERPVTVHEHPSLAAMASYVASRSPATAPHDPAGATATVSEGSGATGAAGAAGATEPPGRSPGSPLSPRPPRSPAGEGSPPASHQGQGAAGLSTAELSAILDAVREERLSVDEATALLAERAG